MCNRVYLGSPSGRRSNDADDRDLLFPFGLFILGVFESQVQDILGLRDRGGPAESIIGARDEFGAADMLFPFDVPVRRQRPRTHLRRSRTPTKAKTNATHQKKSFMIDIQSSTHSFAPQYISRILRITSPPLLMLFALSSVRTLSLPYPLAFSDPVHRTCPICVSPAGLQTSIQRRQNQTQRPQPRR